MHDRYVGMYKYCTYMKYQKKKNILFYFILWLREQQKIYIYSLVVIAFLFLFFTH